MATSSTTMAAGETTLGQDGIQYLAKTMAAGGASLQMSQLASSKASNSYVKQFARAEVAEQTTMVEVLTSIPGAPKSTGPAADDAATIKALQNAKTGLTFDRMYIQAQLSGHKKLQAFQKDGMRMSNREVMNYAKLADSQISTHIEILNLIQTSLRPAK